MMAFYDERAEKLQEFSGVRLLCRLWRQSAKIVAVKNKASSRIVPALSYFSYF
jgi:hypothetical protein